MNHIIGIMAMVFGFISLAINNISGAYGCFGFAFILWVVLAIYEYAEFVDAPDLDDYVSVTPEQLWLNRELVHRDLLKRLVEGNWNESDTDENKRAEE